jgi:hypothetical protein
MSATAHTGAPQLVTAEELAGMLAVSTRTGSHRWKHTLAAPGSARMDFRGLP